MNTKKNVIPQVRTITRYGTGSVILFNYAESPTETILEGDSVQTGSHDTFLSRFALSYGMTNWINKFSYSIHFKHIIAIVAMFASFCANAQENWHNCNCDTPIYYRICESGKDYQVKCKFLINKPLDKCIDIFCNAENHTKWIYNCIESRTLKTDSTSGIFRNIIEAPFFMKDREAFVEYKVTHNDDGSITITNICLPDYRPRNDKYERITRLKATYIFSSKGKNSTEVDYFTETGGPANLPDFLLHIFLCKSTMQTIENLNKMN